MKEKKMASNIRKGAEVGFGFFAGYAIGTAILWIGKLILLFGIIFAVGTALFAVCATNADKVDTQIVAPLEKKLNIDIVNPPKSVTYARQCWIRKRPTTRSGKLGVITPGRKYYIHKKKGKWIKLYHSFNKQGWVGCTPAPKTDGMSI
jgi:uncharacterized protein YgiM (DUF1202 family)